jgi:hypothetical protein
MRRTGARRLVIALTMATMPGGCVSMESISPERAVVERAAIHHDLRNDTGTLYVIASKRVKSSRPELRERPVVCAISNIEIQFTSEIRATYTVAYACGVAPWQLGKNPPVATPVVALEVLKEHGTWMINSFL